MTDAPGTLSPLELAEFDRSMAHAEIGRANEAAVSMQKAIGMVGTVGGALGLVVLKQGVAPVGGVCVVVAAAVLLLMFDRTLFTIAPQLKSTPMSPGWTALPAIEQSTSNEHYQVVARMPALNTVGCEARVLASIAVRKHNRNRVTAWGTRVGLIVGVVGLVLTALQI